MENQDAILSLQTLLEELDRIVAIVSEQMGEIIANARWYSTIVLAEIAAIVKFSSDLEGFWLKALFVVSLILLGLAVAALIYSLNQALTNKSRVIVSASDVRSKLLPLIDADSKELDRGTAQNFIRDLQKLLTDNDFADEARAATTFGLGVLLLGSLAAVVLFVVI